MPHNISYSTKDLSAAWQEPIHGSSSNKNRQRPRRGAGDTGRSSGLGFHIGRRVGRKAAMEKKALTEQDWLSIAIPALLGGGGALLGGGGALPGLLAGGLLGGAVSPSGQKWLQSLFARAPWLARIAPPSRTAGPGTASPEETQTQDVLSAREALEKVKPPTAELVGGMAAGQLPEAARYSKWLERVIGSPTASVPIQAAVSGLIGHSLGKYTAQSAGKIRDFVQAVDKLDPAQKTQLQHAGALPDDATLKQLREMGTATAATADPFGAYTLKEEALAPMHPEMVEMLGDVVGEDLAPILGRQLVPVTTGLTAMRFVPQFAPYNVAEEIGEMVGRTSQAREAAKQFGPVKGREWLGSLPYYQQVLGRSRGEAFAETAERESPLEITARAYTRPLAAIQGIATSLADTRKVEQAAQVARLGEQLQEMRAQEQAGTRRYTSPGEISAHVKRTDPNWMQRVDWQAFGMEPEEWTAQQRRQWGHRPDVLMGILGGRGAAQPAQQTPWSAFWGALRGRPTPSDPVFALMRGQVPQGLRTSPGR